MSKKAAKVEEVAVESEMPSVDDVATSAAEIVLGRMLSCGSCRFWARTGPSFGQCMLSGKFGSAPIVTTDKANCTSWAE